MVTGIYAPDILDKTMEHQLNNTFVVYGASPEDCTIDTKDGQY